MFNVYVMKIFRIDEELSYLVAATPIPSFSNIKSNDTDGGKIALAWSLF